MLVLVGIDGEDDRFIATGKGRGLGFLVPCDFQIHRVCNGAQRRHGAVVLVLVRHTELVVEYNGLIFPRGLVLYADRNACLLGIVCRECRHRAHTSQHRDRQNAGYDLLDLHSYILLIVWTNLSTWGTL